MRVEDDFREMLLSILEIGILRIRALAIAGRAQECEKEPDHLHNVPGLVRSFDWDRFLLLQCREAVVFGCHNKQYRALSNHLDRLNELIETTAGRKGEGKRS